MDYGEIIHLITLAIHEDRMVKIIYKNYRNERSERFIKEIKFSKKYYDFNKDIRFDREFNYIEAFCILKNEIRTFKLNRILFVSDGGNEFPFVKIGTQIWMTENLNVDRFQNGDKIWDKPYMHEDTAGYYSYPEKRDDLPKIMTLDLSSKKLISKLNYSYLNQNNEKKYGKLYNWQAVNDPRGLAPKGYHIPTLDEWKTLMNFLKSNKQIKLTNLEETQTSDGKKHCGFDVKLSGIMDGVRHLPFYYGINECGKSSFWWSSTLFFLDEMKSKTGKGLRAEGIKMFGSNDQMINMIEETWKGMSVRCIKNK